MSYITQLVLENQDGASTYTIKDPGAVQYASLQNLPASLQRQARQNIGANNLVVTVTDGMASHTPAQIRAHVENGGMAVLSMDEEFTTLSHCNESNASFVTALDENILMKHVIWEDGTYEYFEDAYSLANQVPALILWTLSSRPQMSYWSMTWAQFCDSKYNYDRVYCEAGSVYDRNGDLVADAQNRPVAASDRIQACTDYFTL